MANKKQKPILEIIYIIASVYLSQFLASFIVKYLPTPVNIAEFLYYLLYILIEITLIYYLPRKINISDTSLLLPKSHTLPSFTDLGLAPIAFVFVYIFTNITIGIFSNFQFFAPNEPQDVGVSFLYTGPEKLLFFIFLCLIIPILEELIFRGSIYARLKSINNKKLWTLLSIIIVSLIFAIMHGQWNVGIMAFWLSVASCVLYEITGTIYAGILLHIIKNTIAFLLLYVAYI